MAVLLSNLSARVPTIDDLEAVTELIIDCDIAEYTVSDCTKEDILFSWQKAGFNMKTDAWVIANVCWVCLGLCCLWHRNYVQMTVFVRVHPQYCGRGIGTLLLRLIEERARQLVSLAQPGFRVTLSNTVSNTNVLAQRLLEKEGYTAIGHFWRIVVELDEEASVLNYTSDAASNNEIGGRSRRKVELVVDSHSLSSSTRLYNTYEKELRAGKEWLLEDKVAPQLVQV